MQLRLNFEECRRCASAGTCNRWPLWDLDHASRTSRLTRLTVHLFMVFNGSHVSERDLDDAEADGPAPDYEEAEEPAEDEQARAVHRRPPVLATTGPGISGDCRLRAVRDDCSRSALHAHRLRPRPQSQHDRILFLARNSDSVRCSSPTRPRHVPSSLRVRHSRTYWQSTGPQRWMKRS